MIADRLSIVLENDQIIVRDDSRVAAAGTHDQLVETSPLYRELATATMVVPRGTKRCGLSAYATSPFGSEVSRCSLFSEGSAGRV